MLFVKSPLSGEDIQKLRRCGEGKLVFISGVFYTLRDSSVAKLKHLPKEQIEHLRGTFNGAVAYFAAPSAKPPWFRSGAFGPTTSSRFSHVADFLASLGFRAFCGKGAFSPPEGTFYFLSFGGAGAYLAGRVVGYTDFLFPELGPESIKRVTVKRFPVLVFRDGFTGTASRGGV